MAERPDVDIADAWAAIAEAETQLESAVPPQRELFVAVAELRADITNGESCQESLRALRVVLARTAGQ
jgi:hypothetical protein